MTAAGRRRPDTEDERRLAFLDRLAASGEWLAGGCLVPRLADAFGLGDEEAGEVVGRWMRTFRGRHFPERRNQ